MSTCAAGCPALPEPSSGPMQEMNGGTVASDGLAVCFPMAINAVANKLSRARKNRPADRGLGKVILMQTKSRKAELATFSCANLTLPKEDGEVSRNLHQGSGFVGGSSSVGREASAPDRPSFGQTVRLDLDELPAAIRSSCRATARKRARRFCFYKSGSRIREGEAPPLRY
uniref:Uncharacterized protein n=1 Tax=Trichuris muris TaxID=70415 RepID=A0A5S6QUN6_TRIMR